MALLFCDSFDHYATADLAEKWTSVGTYNTVSPTITANGRTNNCVRWTTASANQAIEALLVTPALGASGDTSICGLALKVSNLGSFDNGSYAIHMGIWDGSTFKFGYRLTNTGVWECGKAATPNTYTSSGVPLQNDTWAFVEFKTVLHDTTGSVGIRVNGTTVLTQTNIDTIGSGSATWSSVALFGTTQTVDGPLAMNISNMTIDIDDFYLLDGTDSGITGRPNNDFLGDVTCRYMPPTSDSAVTWDRSAGGDNYALVAEGGSVPQTPDDDTTYVSTSTVDEIDYYGFPDVATGAQIYGVQGVISAKKGDTGSAQIAACVKVSGGSDQEHSNPLGIASESAYSYFLFPWDGSPETGSAWTESEVNGAAFGPRKTA